MYAWWAGTCMVWHASRSQRTTFSFILLRPHGFSCFCHCVLQVIRPVNSCELLGDSYVCPFHFTTRVLDCRCGPLDPAPPPPPHTHCLIRLLDLYSKHFYPWTIFLTPGVRFFSFSTCLLWKGWLYHDLCLWGWWTACRSWFSPIIEDSGIKHVVGLGDKYPFLLSLLTGPRYSVSQVSFRSLHFFFLGMCPFHST